MTNPFDAERDPDRHFIWHRLVCADSEAFAAGEWRLIEDDFSDERFEGIRCGQSTDPRDWQIAFPTLSSYRDSWLAASRKFLAKAFPPELTPAAAIYRRCRIRRIDIAGDRAMAFKEFSGEVRLADGSTLSGERLTIYRLHRIERPWKIVGFLGQLPLSREPRP